MFARSLRPLINFRSFASKSGRLAGRTAIITGGSSGIGRASAILFAREGAKVLVADLDTKGATQTVDMIKSAGGEGHVITVDVTKANDCKKMVEEAERLGNFKIIFNNAGISHADDDDAVKTTEQIWDLTFQVNVKGIFLGCKYAIPALIKNGGGSIINTASFVAILGAATPQLAYTASKGAVLSMTRELSTIHARQGIRVNALCPGPLNTELLQKYLNTEEKRQRRLVHVPMGRFGEAEEIANAALFLASDESSFVTGSTFLADGGITSAYTTPL